MTHLLKILGNTEYKSAGAETMTNYFVLLSVSNTT